MEVSKHEYKPHDTSVLYHEDDPALTPIRLSLPTPPRLELIDGYGLEPKKQKFKAAELPHKLKRLEELALKKVKDLAENDKSYTATIYKVQKEYWKMLSEEREYYKEEIEWVKKQWWHIVNGYWFFCNGKPTFITGWNYFYLNFWNIDGQFKPDYRDRDRKEFIFFDYSYTTHETFANLDRNGLAVANDDGSYDMIEMENRTCFGVGQNKNRRSGNTNKGLSIVYLMTCTHRGTDGGVILSMSGDSSEKHMDGKLLPSWRKMPMFLKPITSSRNNPDSIIHRAPNSVMGEDSLENAISMAESAQSTAVDGNKYWCMLIDESGKATTVDVRERHGVAMHCISTGNGSVIFGWEYQPSTAEEMSKGGKAYKGLLDDSFFYRRNEISGQTRSGLFRLFMPADESLEGYIDEYGGSVKGMKLLPEHKKAGFNSTATLFLKSERDQLLRDSKANPEVMVTYRMKKKQFPLCYDDSWIGNAGDIGFDVEIIDKRLATLSRDSQTERFDMQWIGTPFKSGVKVIPDPINGKWHISKLLPNGEANQYITDTFWDAGLQEDVTTYRPKYPTRFTCGADPFNFRTESQAKVYDGVSKKSTGRASDGGIAVFWNRDYLIDPEGKSSKEFITSRFVCTYRYRETDNHIYAEDVLKTCVYYGAMCFPEINIRVVWDDFHRWGFDGFLKYQVDPVTGKMKDSPGVTSLERSKQEGFSELRNYVSLHGNRECHEDLLYELKSINGMEEMTRYDLLAAAMCALIGSKSSYDKIVEDESSFNYDITKLMSW